MRYPVMQGWKQECADATASSAEPEPALPVVPSTKNAAGHQQPGYVTCSHRLTVRDSYWRCRSCLHLSDQHMIMSCAVNGMMNGHWSVLSFFVISKPDP